MDYLSKMIQSEHPRRGIKMINFRIQQTKFNIKKNLIYTG